MARSPSKTGQRLAVKRTARPRRKDLDERVLAHLLRTSLRAERTIAAKGIAEELGLPYSTATATLRRLSRSGRLIPGYAVNNFQTRYCHEYAVSLAIRGGAIAASDKKRRERLAKTGDDGLRDGGPAERFLEELLAGLASRPEYRAHLIVLDAVLLHGAPDRDVELSVISDDGAYSLGHWIRDVLAGNPGIRAMHTATVGFRYSRNGYSGQYVNHWHVPAHPTVADAGA